jgi:hypothetical protein
MTTYCRFCDNEAIVGGSKDDPRPPMCSTCADAYDAGAASQDSATPTPLTTCKRILRAIEWSVTDDRMTPKEQAALLRAAIRATEGK